MPSLLIHSLLKSLTPLLLGGSYHLFKETLSIGTTSNLNFDDFQQKLNNNETNPEDTSFDGFFLMLNQISFGLYSNFFAFMLAMILIDIMCNLIKVGIKDFLKEAKSSRISLDHNDCSIYSSQRKGTVYQISENQIMRIFSYALTFILLQIAGLALNFTTQNQALRGIRHEPMAAIEKSQDPKEFSSFTMMNDDQENYLGIPTRILEEKEETQDNKLEVPALSLSSPPVTSDKISLSMGNVLSSLNLNVNAMVISKDRKTAYVTLDLYGTLKVIDISDLQSPFVRASLNLQTTTYLYQIKNLLLSSDEKTLYASNTRNIEIIDISDRDSPKLLSLTKSEIFADSGVNAYYGLFKTALAVEEKTKTLYIEGIGLQVYDISEPEKPILLKAVRNDASSVLSITRNDLSLSCDRKTLFFTNGAMGVYDISDPKDMKLLYSLETESSPRSIMLLEPQAILYHQMARLSMPVLEWKFTFLI